MVLHGPSPARIHPFQEVRPIARSSPQSFQKRQRERRKQQKRQQKFEARLYRAEEKRWQKLNPGRPLPPRDEDGWLMDPDFYRRDRDSEESSY